jgi:hypothetical protein
VQPWPKATTPLPATFGCRIDAAALEPGAQGALEKKTLTATVALPVPGATPTAKSLVLTSRLPPGEAEVAVSEPAIEEPGAALV